jgi:hypothetical protein
MTFEEIVQDPPPSELVEARALRALREQRLDLL